MPFVTCHVNCDGDVEKLGPMLTADISETLGKPAPYIAVSVVPEVWSNSEFGRIFVLTF